MVIREIPSPKKTPSNEGGLMKFGGAPDGFGAIPMVSKIEADMTT